MLLHRLHRKHQIEGAGEHCGLIVPYAFHRRVGDVHLKHLLEFGIKQVELFHVQHVEDGFPVRQRYGLLSGCHHVVHGLLTTDVVFGIELAALCLSLKKCRDAVQQRAGQRMDGAKDIRGSFHAFAANAEQELRIGTYGRQSDG